MINDILLPGVKRIHQEIPVGYLLPITEKVDIRVIVPFSLIDKLFKFTGLNARWERSESCNLKSRVFHILFQSLLSSIKPFK